MRCVLKNLMIWLFCLIFSFANAREFPLCKYYHAQNWLGFQVLWMRHTLSTIVANLNVGESEPWQGFKIVRFKTVQRTWAYLEVYIFDHWSFSETIPWTLLNQINKEKTCEHKCCKALIRRYKVILGQVLVLKHNKFIWQRSCCTY